jgi:phospholipid N-methyltransferase
MNQPRSIRFLTHFLRHPRQVGAVWPSSRFLAAAMVEGLAVGPGETVVELGPGTGAFTEAILNAKHSQASYLGIEISESFVKMLRDRFPEDSFSSATFVCGSAEQMVSLHREAQLPAVKAVVCGLPFASLPVSVQDDVLAGLEELLSSGGTFTTFQYVHAYQMHAARRFRQRMSQLFGQSTRSRPVMRNTPPAYVVRWERKVKSAQ